MDLNTASKLPEWLTPEKIKMYKEFLTKAVPYTEEEVDDIPFDSTDYDVDRMNAYGAKRILSKYNLIDPPFLTIKCSILIVSVKICIAILVEEHNG